MSTRSVGLPPQQAPWLRSAVGAPKGKPTAKGRPKASSARGAHLRSGARNASGQVVAPTSVAAGSGGSTVPAVPARSVDTVPVVSGGLVVGSEAGEVAAARRVLTLEDLFSDSEGVDDVLGGASTF